MAWNRSDIRSRVEARLAILGKKLDDVLPGYSFFAPSNEDVGVTIAILEKLADGLGWSLCELLCESKVELIELAVITALKAVPSDRLEKLPAATISAFESLEAYERDRVPVDAEALAHIERNLRVQYRVR